MLDNDPEMQQAIEEKPLGDAAAATPEKPAQEAKSQDEAAPEAAAEPAGEANTEPEAEKAAEPEAGQKPEAAGEPEAQAPSEPKAESESKPRKPSGGADDNVVFIGKKDVMSYVLAVMTQFNNEQNEVIIKARGRTISRAVDVAEISRQKIGDISPAKIEISTEEIQGDEGTVKVSAIEITLSKK